MSLKRILLVFAFFTPCPSFSAATTGATRWSPTARTVVLNGILNTPDLLAVCLSEQIKPSNNRQRMINSFGLLVAHHIASNFEKLNPKLALRLIGANIGEILNLCSAVKNGQIKQHFGSLSKRDVIASIAKTLLINVAYDTRQKLYLNLVAGPEMRKGNRRSEFDIIDVTKQGK